MISGEAARPHIHSPVLTSQRFPIVLLLVGRLRPLRLRTSLRQLLGLRHGVFYPAGMWQYRRKHRISFYDTSVCVSLQKSRFIRPGPGFLWFWATAAHWMSFSFSHHFREKLKRLLLHNKKKSQSTQISPSGTIINPAMTAIMEKSKPSEIQFVPSSDVWCEPCVWSSWPVQYWHCTAARWLAGYIIELTRRCEECVPDEILCECINLSSSWVRLLTRASDWLAIGLKL